MKKYSVVYEEIGNNVESVGDFSRVGFGDADVIINTGVSLHDLKHAKKLLCEGEITSLFHIRIPQKIEYKTKIITKDDASILIDGGLSSGYVGGGTGAFEELLIYLGVEKKEAEYLSEDHKYRSAKITIRFE